MRSFLLSTVMMLAASGHAAPVEREWYRDPAWQPRAHPTLEEVVGGKFHPPPPALPAPVTYEAPGYAEGRLRPAPPVGVHPRVLVTPDDVADIRARVRQGDAAPAEFRALWKRLVDSRSAFAAHVMQDEELGRSLAAQFAERVRALEPKLDRLDAQEDAGNLWSAERSLIASGDPEPPSELWTLLDYDYLHGWLSPDEREQAERVILRIVKGRISNFLAEPDHFMINNHKGFGMEFIRLMLLVEGKPGFPEETFRAAAHKCHAMLDWYLSPDGMCYESIKGWINVSAFIAVARRDDRLLRHDHLLAKMRFFQSTLRWEEGRWVIREEMRASAFHVIWLMRFLYPENRVHDLLYSATLSTHPFLTDPSERWPDPVGIAPELLLMLAGGGRGDDRAGRLEDWTSQKAIDSLNLPITWKDDLRGYLEARNSWRIGDLHLGFTNKQDFFYGGHEGSEANRLVLWKDGVNWIRDEDLLAVKATGLQNMLTVDGRGLAWPPVPGVWLGVREGPHGISAAGDARLAYTYGKVMQVHPLAFPSGKLPYYAPFTEANFDLTRDLEVAFHPGTIAFNDGYAHTDYGPWSGETRLVEHYKLNNPMEQVDRTVHLARGTHPYVLVMDDAVRPDRSRALYEVSFNLPDGAVVVDARTTEIQFQNVEPSERRESEFLIATAAVTRDPETGRPAPRRGEPLLLVRILHRFSAYGYPVPRIQVLPGRPERPFNRFTQLVVPAIAERGEFRILFYPHRQGDPLPVTSWTDARSQLTVTLPGQRDTYRFERTDGGRTVHAFSRNDAEGLALAEAPARPVLIVRGDRFDAASLRTTRREGVAPVYPFSGTESVTFEGVPAPAEIRYTLDGSEPGPSAQLYRRAIVVRESATLRARVIDPSWPGSVRQSAELTARFEKRRAQPGAKAPADGAATGLRARIYEIPTHMWDDRGFFRANLIMLPNLDRHEPMLVARTGGTFALPHAVPMQPIEKQAKGFYRLDGWLRVQAPGPHSFRVNSCGPVLFVVGGQDVIAETGVFHQGQRERSGIAVLGAGWHPVELIVTDPLFWNLATTGPMPFSVKMREPGTEHFLEIPAERLAAVQPDGIAPQSPAYVWRDDVKPPVALERGVMRSAYEREGLTRQPDYLDVEGLSPRSVAPADRIEANTNPAQVVVYEGWFQAPQDGVYRFALPVRRERSAGLGEFRAAYQNQLRISGEIVAQHGVAGRVPLREIGLRAGWHFVSLRLGSSPADVSVTYPDGSTLPLDAALLSRAALVSIRPVDTKAGPRRDAWEIYGPTDFILETPTGVPGEIRFTKDGSLPTAESPLAPEKLRVQADARIRAAVFRGGEAVTEASDIGIRLVKEPEAARIAQVRFDQWKGDTGIIDLNAGCRVWFAGFVSRSTDGGFVSMVSTPPPTLSGPGGVDINMTRGAGRVPLKLHHLRMRDPEFTVGVWFRSDAGEGSLFGKQGLTAFGKSYRTVSVRLEGGRVRAEPGRLAGGRVETGRWHHVALSATPARVVLYVDGVPVDEGPGAPGLATDALDFLADHPGALRALSIYNRELSAEEVGRLHASGVSPGP